MADRVLYSVQVKELDKDPDALHWWVEQCRETFRSEVGRIDKEDFVNEYEGVRKPHGQVWFYIETTGKKV